MFTVYLNDGTKKRFATFRQVRKSLKLSKNFLSKIAKNGITYLPTGETVLNLEAIADRKIFACVCRGLA